MKGGYARRLRMNLKPTAKARTLPRLDPVLLPLASAYQDARLQTAVERIAYDYTTRTGRLDMPVGCCTDMGGAIALFRALHPAVERIETFAGGRLDTLYRLEGGGWAATRSSIAPSAEVPGR